MTSETSRPDKMPSVFVGVGGPRQIWDDEWNDKLHGWAESMPRPGRGVADRPSIRWAP